MTPGNWSVYDENCCTGPCCNPRDDEVDDEELELEEVDWDAENGIPDYNNTFGAEDAY